jgi:hypothetical protein
MALLPWKYQGVAGIRRALEIDQEADEKKIASLLGLVGPAVASGKYEWFKSTDWHSQAHSAPSQQESRQWYRQVTVSPIEHPESRGLKTIEVEADRGFPATA